MPPNRNISEKMRQKEKVRRQRFLHKIRKPKQKLQPKYPSRVLIVLEEAKKVSIGKTGKILRSRYFRNKRIVCLLIKLIWKRYFHTFLFFNIVLRSLKNKQTYTRYRDKNRPKAAPNFAESDNCLLEPDSIDPPIEDLNITLTPSSTLAFPVTKHIFKLRHIFHWLIFLLKASNYITLHICFGVQFLRVILNCNILIKK